MLAAAAFALAFAVGELALRRVERGAAPTRVAPGGDFVPHAHRGYMPNPAIDGVNSLGFRHDEIAVDKPRGLFRVIVLGDSIAWASGGFVSKLRERFDEARGGPVEIINAAIPGYTTYQERVLLEHDLLATRPDLVLLQYCLNDNHRFLHEVVADGGWVMTRDARDAYLGEGPFGWLTRRSRLIFRLRVAIAARRPRPKPRYPWEHRVGAPAAWLEYTWGEFEAHLRSMKRSLDEIDARFAVVAVPLEAQLRADFLRDDRDYVLRPQARLREVGSRVGVPLLDLHPVFVARRETRLFKDGLHLSDEGHELAASAILTFIRDRGLAARLD